MKGSLGYLLRKMGKQVAGFKEGDDSYDHAPSFEYCYPLRPYSNVLLSLFPVTLQCGPRLRHEIH